MNGYTIKSEDVVGGYVVLAVDDRGKRKTSPNVGDEVLLMCGAACKTAGGSSGYWDIQYTWTYDNGSSVTSETTNTITVTMNNLGPKAYRCGINSACGTPSKKLITFNVAGINVQ